MSLLLIILTDDFLKRILISIKLQDVPEITGKKDFLNIIYEFQLNKRMCLKSTKKESFILCAMQDILWKFWLAVNYSSHNKF